METTMAQQFDFYFDFGSLASYLAHTQLPRITAETGAQPVMSPMLLGGVFQATGNASPMAVPAKGRYVFIDMKRFADEYGVPLVMNHHFPIITTTLMRGATALQMQSADASGIYQPAEEVSMRFNANRVFPFIYHFVDASFRIQRLFLEVRAVLSLYISSNS
jgi:2-hydroxychromene-2-carboxylate isomerase